MRRSPFLAVLAVPVALFATTTGAWAYFAAQGSGQGGATVGSLAPPTAVVGTPVGGTVGVTWTGVSSPGPGTLGYYVTRTPVPSGTAVDVCGSRAAPLAAAPTSCTDTSVPPGTYEYRVVATYATWTAPSGPSADVVVDRASTTTSLELSSSTATSGSEQLLDVTVTVSPQTGPPPTGTVDVTAGGTGLCTITLPDTSCSPDPDALGPSGTPYPVVATYSGDSTFSGSSSDPSDLTVYDALAITTASLAPAWAGETGYSQTLAATGGYGAYAWSVETGVLPTGLALDRDTGTISGTLVPSTFTSSVTFSVTDANGASVSQSLTITVTNPYVRQVSIAPAGQNSSFQVTLTNGVTAGHALVLTVAQSCMNGVGAFVDSHVTGVTGNSLTWVKAAATGCTADGDAEVWYGIGTVTGGSSTKVTVQLNAAAVVEFANVTEYAHLAAFDSSSLATSTASGSGAAVSSGSVTPATAGEFVVGGAFVTRATPSSVAGLVGPFANLNSVSPDKGFGVYAVDATTAPLTLGYTQTVSGTPTPGPWAAVLTCFALTP